MLVKSTPVLLNRLTTLRWPSGKSVCLWSCRLDFDSESGQTNDFKIGIASLLVAQHERDSVENKPASLLVVPLVKALSEISHLSVVDRWPATPKRARCSSLIAFS